MNYKITFFKRNTPLFRYANAYFLLAFCLYSAIVSSQTFSSSIPVANNNLVETSANIVMNFTLPVTLSSTNTFVRGSQSGRITGAFSGGGTTTNTFNPDDPFLPGELITVQLTTATGGPTTAYNFSFRVQPSINTITSSPNPTTVIEHGITNISKMIDVAVGDLDSDGALDIIALSHTTDELIWYKNNDAPIPTFTVQPVLFDDAGIELQSVVLGDANNDGDLDIFFGSEVGDKVYFIQNQGSGVFLPAVEINSGTANGLSTVFLGDLNGDGLIDILASSANDNTLAWYPNLGSNNFDSETIITTGLGGAISVKVGDMDGDGDLDVIGAGFTADVIQWYPNNGDGTFGTPITAINGLNGVSSISIGDIDNDGDLDIAATSLFQDEVNWYENTLGTGTSFTERLVYKVINSTSDRAVNVDLKDMDGDGDLDILWAADVVPHGGGTIAWSQNQNNASSWTYIPVDAVARRGYSVDAADLNGDGTLELIGAALDDTSTSTVSWYAYNTNVWTGTVDTDWDTEANWSLGNIPTVTTIVEIDTNTNIPIIGTAHTVHKLSITALGALTVNAGLGDLTVQDSLTINHGGSLVVNGAFTGGTLAYNVNIPDTNWHLVSAPVTTEQYDDAWITANSIASGTGNNRGIATYSNTTDANGDWTYFQSGGTAENFTTAQGYSMLRSTSGNYSFIGSLETSDQDPTITASDLGGANENRWNLIGNPFPSYIDVNAFLTLPANALALTDTHQAIYVWTGTTYTPINSGYVHPGQGFFVSSNIASTTVALDKNMLSHQTGVTFYKNGQNSFPKLRVHLSDGATLQSSTEIQYREGKMRALDPGFDLGSFTGASNNFEITTHLLEGSTGEGFAVQALPSVPEGLHDEIIPLSVKAASGTELNFSITLENFPSDTEIYIEDVETEMLVSLDEANNSYNVILNDAITGIGRFYLHTNPSTLNMENLLASKVKIYTANGNLHVKGLSEVTVNLVIYDLLGRKTLSHTFLANGNDQIKLASNVSKGVYIVRLDTGKGMLSKKIVIE